MLQMPYCLEREKYILGCLLLDKQDYVVKLKETDFYGNTNKAIFEAIKHLYDKKEKIDFINVSDVLKSKLENSFETIVELEGFVLTTVNFENHYKELKKYTVRREIIKKSLELQELALNSEHDNAIDIKSDAMQKLGSIEVMEAKKKSSAMGDIMLDVMNDIEEKFNEKEDSKLYTGFYDYDKITAGLHKEELTIIAARPGVGKTAFALQLLIQLAHKGNKCLFVSREMSTIQIAKRILSNISKIDGHKLRLCKCLVEEDWTAIANAQGYISALPIEINDEISTIQEIRAYCRELSNKNKLDVLFVDYIGLITTLKKRESRRLEIEDISRQFKEMCLEFRIPIVVLSQLSRTSVKENREPIATDLRESGSIEQDADNIVFLHIPSDTDTSENKIVIKAKVEKQRNGSTGSVYLDYYKNLFKFYNKSYRS